MQLTQDHLSFYETHGYLFLPECFSKPEVRVLKDELNSVFAEDTERRVLEKDKAVVRSVYGTHATNEVFNRLSRHPKIVQPAMAILDNNVYVYQFKINAKAGFGGDVWQWHQDYIFWLKEDGLPTDRVTTAVIFLNDVNRFNAPMFLIPGSHKDGVIDVMANQRSEGGPYGESPAWISNLTADLKYGLSNEIISDLVSRYGIFSAEGPSGSLLFFHSNLVHGSTINISPFDRSIVLASYSSIDNVPCPIKNPRPEFLVSRNCDPIVPLGDDALFV